MAFLMSQVSVASMLYVMSYLAFNCAAEDNKTAKQTSSIVQPPTFCYGGIPGMHGKPGSPGAPGRDGRYGRDGRDGTKGDQGSSGKTGPQGPPGTPGINGKNGAKGEPGVQGPPGQKGQRGEGGGSGIPRTSGVMAYKNWKECAWKNIDDGKDHGLIKECVFTKNFSDTSLHVYWTGVLRISGCDSCCRRWYFTLNGAECAAPLPIDGLVYTWKSRSQNIHRVNNIEGHCNNIHKARCAWDSGLVIVLVIEMLTPSQAGIQCLGSLLRKFPNLKLRCRDKTSIPA